LIFLVRATLIKYTKREFKEIYMSMEVFVALCAVGFWAMLPASLAIAVRDFDDAIIDDDHH
jgi:hypothetical protein